jgi:FKBP-type peptidyl-prolyl cis-trans isomerase
MFNRFELLGIGVSVFSMALALYLIRVETSLFRPLEVSSQAATIESGIVIVEDSENPTNARAQALLEASNGRNTMEQIVIEDVTPGTGREVADGDTVSVHYIGRLQDGREFDNSYNRGQAFTFTVGEGRVIQGWEEGIVGLREGGTRILVIPPHMAYGDREVGPIPANSTLVFSIELLSIQ